MRSQFVVCPSCSRHVRAGEADCPFCAKALAADLVPAPHGPRRNYIGKNATALAIAALAAGCGGETVETPANDSAVETSQSDSIAADTQTMDTADTFASDVQDEGGPVPIYK